MVDFKGRYVVLTGCGKGIGKAIAKKFLENGVSGLAMVDYDGALLEKTAAELDPEGTRTSVFVCDISRREQVRETINEIIEKYGRIDAIVNNAGITRDAMSWKMTEDQMRAVMEVNFFGTYYCCNEVIPLMREQKYGRIVNISSTSAHGNVGQTNYAASKAAVNGYTKTLALELARKGITANTVEPGFVDTDMMRAVPSDILEKKIAAHPMLRLGAPSEIASLVLFLASEEASYVSGCNIVCAGAAKIIG